MARSTIVEAYMTHGRSPRVTELRSDGRIRKVTRHQHLSANGWEVAEQELKAKYGDRWLGVIGVEAAAKKAEVAAAQKGKTPKR